MPQNTSVSRTSLVLLAVLTASMTACGDAPSKPTGMSAYTVQTAETAPPETAPHDSPSPKPIPALRGGRLRPDVLVTGTAPLSAGEIRKVASLAPGSVAFASGTIHLSGKPVRVASVDPVTFRRYAAAGTAESNAVWQTVADGGLVASHDLAKRLRLPLGQNLKLIGRSPVDLRLGALATTGIPGTDLVVATETGRRLGLTAPSAVLLNAGTNDPVSLASKVRKVAGVDAEVDLLTPPAANPVAFLSGSKAAKAFGAFSYKYFPDGTIQPDASWVSNNIASTTVPILGKVTCHRLMIPQLRGALEDVVEAGLASSLKTYDGCYVPRFIERNPENSISLHTWGIAIDMDASTNYRGIKGTMHPQVVEIFKRWGFRWGGDWKYTDPMHFEIGALLTSPR